MRYGDDHKQKTRVRILTAAAEAIRADGPHRVSVAQVMKMAGLTHGGFYAHFASKEDLIAEAIDLMFVEGAEQFSAAGQNRSAEAALSAYIDFYLSRAHRDQHKASCPLPLLAADAPRLEGQAQTRFSRGAANLEAKLATHLTKAAPGQNAAEEAGSILAELVGAVSLARAEPNARRSDEILARSRAALKRRLGLEALP